ncbi:hypothetical protein FBQ84_02450 [Ignavibacteria bacterium CHB1]|nr:MAG: hypothetical protein EDM69_02920 [Chlorobiota bacterium]MBV6397904.1 hypothetical protein [Ignavibacteria bacterium]MCC6884877.1 hypothetical protein [Ignavibacteriales bacterium]MCE7952576.1 hypothetical protein [Chlorobi bacterium CHB7]MDL1886690.1 hypothetical protein [Ignavibacteria bacterium CHB1]RIK47977.1 MAG: hypothetical protein DCC60_08825 [Ignavibacteriota bacterium]
MAGNKDRDVKFVIYQVLYIFVICVIALKGANLDLEEVIEKETVVEREYADSLKKYLDSLIALGLVPKIDIDTTLKFSNPEELRQKLQQTQMQLSQITQKMSLTVNQTNPTVTPQVQQEEIPEEKKEEIPKEPSEVSDIRIGSIELTQYTQNTLNNPYDLPLEIVGITTIPPKSTKTFTTGGQSSVTIRVGSSTKTVSLKPNDNPRIIVQKVADVGSYRSLTRVTGFRVTVEDDFPGQLQISVTGPVSVTQSGKVLDIKLNQTIGSESQFDQIYGNQEPPYRINFSVNVKDKVSGKTVSNGGSFVFSEY